MSMLGSSRLRSLLAVDAVATVLAGLLIAFRPGLLAGTAGRIRLLRALATDDRARRAGVLVATFGAGKGLLYALALSRAGDD